MLSFVDFCCPFDRTWALLTDMNNGPVWSKAAHGAKVLPHHISSFIRSWNLAKEPQEDPKGTNYPATGNPSQCAKRKWFNCLKISMILNDIAKRNAENAAVLNWYDSVSYSSPSLTLDHMMAISHWPRCHGSDRRRRWWGETCRESWKHVASCCTILHLYISGRGGASQDRFCLLV